MRIDNGYRLRLAPLATLPRVHALVEDFKRRARPILEDLLYRQAAQLAARVVDQRILGLPPILSGLEYKDEAPLEIAYRVILDQHRLVCDNRGGASFDFDCRIVLLPAEGVILALLRTSWVTVRDAWEATAGVESFPYWDNEDRPEGVSEAAWAIRAGIWTSAVKNGEELSVLGYATECFGRYGLPVPLPDDLLSRLPSLHERAQVYAVERAAQHYVRRQAPKSDTARKLILHDALIWTHQEQEGHVMVEMEREAIAQMLPEINESLLTT